MKTAILNMRIVLKNKDSISKLSEVVQLAHEIVEFQPWNEEAKEIVRLLGEVAGQFSVVQEK